MTYTTVFQSDEIEAIFLPGSSDFLLITFAPIQFKTDIEPFWGKRVAEKASISVIGFVSRTGTNWYPQQDMEIASKKIADITGAYDKIITYGSSMGAYGALKYSALLNATACAAFGAQFSIDPEDIGDPQFTRFFRDQIHKNMSVKGKDVCCNSYVFYDPYFKFDQSNASSIAEAAPQVQLIKVPFAGHECVKVFAGTQAVVSLLQQCLSGDTAEVLKLTRSLRSRSPARNAGLAQHLIARNPKLAFRILERSPQPLDKKQEATFYDYAAVAEINSGNLEEAEKYALKALEILPTRSAFLRRLGNIYDRRKQSDLAINCFNRALSFDAKDSSSHFNLASIFFRKKEISLAMNSITKAVDLIPGEPRYLQLMERISSARNG